jgi:hypothetical protein
VGDRQEDAAPDGEGDSPEEPDDVPEEFDAFANRYYWVQSQFVEDVEIWLEGKAAALDRGTG